MERNEHATAAPSMDPTAGLSAMGYIVAAAMLGGWIALAWAIWDSASVVETIVAAGVVVIILSPPAGFVIGLVARLVIAVYDAASWNHGGRGDHRR